MFSIVFFVNKVHAASFDCKNAKKYIEKMICGDYELSGTDEELYSLYQDSMRHYIRDKVISEQKSWLANTRNNCDNHGCLKKAYNERIDYLTKKHEMICNAIEKSVMNDIEYSSAQNTFGYIAPYQIPVGDSYNERHSRIFKEWDNKMKLKYPKAIHFSEYKEYFDDSKIVDGAVEKVLEDYEMPDTDKNMLLKYNSWIWRLYFVDFTGDKVEDILLERRGLNYCFSKFYFYSNINNKLSAKHPVMVNIPRAEDECNSSHYDSYKLLIVYGQPYIAHIQSDKGEVNKIKYRFFPFMDLNPPITHSICDLAVEIKSVKEP